MRPLLLLLCLSLSMAAHADDAELDRLRSSLRSQIERNIWGGAERTFTDMERQGADQLTAEDWRLGMRIARTRGDMAAVQRRAQSAFQLEPTDELRTELSQISAEYGPVRVEIASGYKGPLEPQPASPPFNPDQRAAIEAAGRILARDRSYQGLLPTGRYTLGPTDFEVAPGSIEPVVVRMSASGEASISREADRDEGHRTLEVLLHVGPTFGAATRAESGVQPEPFAGAGLRVGGGLTYWPIEPVGVQIEVGYQGLFAEGAKQASNGDALPPTTLQLGYVFAGVAARFGPLTLTAGPQIAVGRASATGLDRAALNAECQSQPSTPGCDQRAALTDAALSEAALRSSVTSVGPTLGATVQLGEFGPVRPAIGASGGALNDGARWLPWAQLALEVRL